MLYILIHNGTSFYKVGLASWTNCKTKIFLDFLSLQKQQQDEQIPQNPQSNTFKSAKLVECCGWIVWSFGCLEPNSWSLLVLCSKVIPHWAHWMFCLDVNLEVGQQILYRWVIFSSSLDFGRKTCVLSAISSKSALRLVISFLVLGESLHLISP